MTRFAVLSVGAALALAAPFLTSGPALAAEEPERTIVIKEHRFHPEVVEVPAGVRVKLIIHNQDATPEEFESHDLRREKLVTAGGKATIWVGPLPKGEYGFFGEFHEKTAQGKLVAK